MDRKYYIMVNEYKSEVYTSKVGIPQGSVISPNLCNLYTSDAMEGKKRGMLNMLMTTAYGRLERF